MQSSRRTALVLLGVAVAMGTVAVWRRAWFPFSDHLLASVDPDAIAYVHVNFVPSVRDGVRAHIDRVAGMEPALAPWLAAIRPAVTSLFAREIAVEVAWRTQELRYGVTVVVDPRAGAVLPNPLPEDVVVQDVQFSVRLGQPASASYASDLDAMEMALAPMRRQPVQLLVRPSLLTSQPTNRDLTAGGVIHARGFRLRSDARHPVGGSEHVAMLLPPQRGDVQISRLHPDILRLIPVMGSLLRTHRFPERVDVIIRDSRWGIRIFGALDEQMSHFLRVVASVVRPTPQRRALDGIPATVLVSDPSAWAMRPTGHRAWSVQSREEPPRDAVFLQEDGFGVYGSSDRLFLRSMMGNYQPETWIVSRSCGQANAQSILARWDVPRGDGRLTLALSPVGSWSLCGNFAY
ncbi:hypothetical protein HYV74_05125 [Candidatus Uhrbacteria bacterium]|nr:hypothetical protein [Candidatus Uhrbacteria bacterium]